MATLDELLRRNSPYQTGIRSEASQIEYFDEEGMLAKWKPIVEAHGGIVMRIEPLPAEKTRIDVDGITWELSLMEGGKDYHVPPNVFNRIKALEAAGVPFAWWIWGEEKFETPRFMPAQAPVVSRAPEKKRDPIVIGVIPTGDRRGIWVLLGKWFK